MCESHGVIKGREKKRAAPSNDINAPSPSLIQRRAPRLCLGIIVVRVFGISDPEAAVGIVVRERSAGLSCNSRTQSTCNRSLVYNTRAVRGCSRGGFSGSTAGGGRCRGAGGVGLDDLEVDGDDDGDDDDGEESEDANDPKPRPTLFAVCLEVEGRGAGRRVRHALRRILFCKERAVASCVGVIAVGCIASGVEWLRGLEGQVGGRAEGFAVASEVVEAGRRLQRFVVVVGGHARIGSGSPRIEDWVVGHVGC